MAWALPLRTAPRPKLAVNSALASSAPLRSARALIWRCKQKSRGRMIGRATPYSLPPSRCCRPQASSSAARLRRLISPLYQQAESCALPTGGHCSASSTANLPHIRRLTAARGLSVTAGERVTSQGRLALVRQRSEIGDAGSMSGLLESGHGWAIYEYTP